MNSYIDPKITIWCDMDGVIAVYEPEGFKGDNPPFLIPNSHYFRHCTPDNRIIQALKLLHEIYHVKIKIISNVLPTLKNEHTNGIQNSHTCGSQEKIISTMIIP